MTINIGNYYEHNRKPELMPIITRDKTFTNYSDIQIVLYQ